MSNHELAMPPESLVEGLTFDVSNILIDVEWDTRLESGLEFREKMVVLDSERMVSIRQLRVPDHPYPIIVSSVRFETSDRMSLARWQTDQSEIGINDFEYTDALRRLLHETNEVAMNQDG